MDATGTRALTGRMTTIANKPSAGERGSQWHRPVRLRRAKARANISVVAITDTSTEAQAIQLKIQHEMSGEQRMLLAFEMSEFARELARAGVRRDRPEWTEAQVARELLRLAFLPKPLPGWLR